MRHGSLFSGIGGFDIAAEWMGWDNVFHCEWNEFGQKILKHYWPNAKSYGDITKTDFTVHRGNIDIITGGFPCQPYSVAGNRKGKEDDRHLWPEMLRAIREVQPRWIVGENVPGLLNWNGGMVLDEIKANLEDSGFEVFPPLVLPACGLNAPHRRDRVWIVAYSKCSAERQNRDSINIERTGITSLQTKDEGRSTAAIFNSGLDVLQRHSTNASNKGLQRSKIIGGVVAKQQNRNEQLAGLFPSNWKEFPTQSPICNGDDGISSQLDGITFSKWRQESIKAGGNAIVPQVVYQIFKAIEELENLKKTMTPEQKAKELIEKFIPCTRQFKDENGWFDDVIAATDASLLCVDEIIAEVFNIGYNTSIMQQYWQQVKTCLSNNEL